MFTEFVVQPIFNLLVLIYALIPGHNFGLAIILFTVVIRLLMWPLVKKQLRQTKITRQLQPELKRIKKEAKGDRQLEGRMMMELYKERGVNPFGMFPTLIVQMVVLIGLYIGLIKVIKDPNQIVQFAYAPFQHLPWMQHLAENIKAFDNSLFGIVDLSKAAVSKTGIYFPALLLVFLSAGIQFLTSRQLMPSDKEARKLRHILRAAGEGQQADQAEVSAAVGRGMVYVIPFMVFFFTINLAAALSLYWFVGGLVAYLQQRRALNDDADRLVEAAESADDKIPTKKAKPSQDNKPVRTTKNGSKVTISSTPEAVVATSTKQIRSKASKKAKKKRR
ncbi:membrane protein insertase YidC [Candidatus Saccharibacteria bacterium]|nr:MAG: membrane protein insertase YidC [Candidatus Saccharibacteria bacterium]